MPKAIPTRYAADHEGTASSSNTSDMLPLETKFGTILFRKAGHFMVGEVNLVDAPSEILLFTFDPGGAAVFHAIDAPNARQLAARLIGAASNIERSVN